MCVDDMNKTTPSPEHAALAQVGAAVRRGDTHAARALLADVLRDHPRSIAAWSWACQVAPTDAARIVCLRRILEIDPDHAAARRYLAQLQPDAPASLPVRPASPPRPVDRLLSLWGWLLDLPAGWLIAAAAAAGLVLFIVYLTVNHDWFGLAEPEWDRLTFSPSMETIQSDAQTWQIVYERTQDSQFAGLVRHASLIRFDRVPFLTHDILVTTGDYADPQQVRTAVIDHHFSWRSATKAHPKGTINLLHTVAVAPEIFAQLLQIRSGDRVVIVGREILSIETYDRSGTYLGNWRDQGCNTLLVRSVEIQAGEKDP